MAYRYYLNNLRVTATFFVVLLHTTSYSSVYNVDDFSQIVLRLYHDIGVFAVPVFVMISGSLFLDCNKQISYKILFQKYVRRIALALVVFGLPMCFLETILNKDGGIDTAIYHFITGHSWDHMWYLYMLIFLYLMTPVLKPFMTHCSKSTIEIGLLVLFVCSILLPTLKHYGCALESWMMFTPYPFYYLLGGYISNTYSSKIPKLTFYVILSLFIVSILISILCGMETPGYYNILSFIGASSIFALFKRTEGNWKLANKISPYTFSIYIIHPIFIHIASKLIHFDPAIYFPIWLSIIPFAFIVFGLAYLSGWLLKKIPAFKYIL